MLINRAAWILAGLLISPSAMGEFKPDIAALVKDLETMTKSEDHMTIVFWLPTEFWRASLESGGKVTAKEIDKFVKELDQYVVLAVADGQVGIAGSVNFAEPELLKGAVTIENARGALLSALPDDAISGGVKNMAEMLRPVWANMLGKLGLHLAVIIFPGTETSGSRTVEPTKEGIFVVHVGPVTVRYRLPLGSLLPPVIDEKTGESFPGNYHFNPFTGHKLSPAPARPEQPAASPAAPAAPPAPSGTAQPSAPQQHSTNQG